MGEPLTPERLTELYELPDGALMDTIGPTTVRLLIDAARAAAPAGELTNYQRGYIDGFDAPANVAARAAAPAGEMPWYADMEVHPVGTYATPAGDPEHPHVPQPSDICSVCGRGLVHVIPSLDPPAPVQAAEPVVEESELDDHPELLASDAYYDAPVPAAGLRPSWCECDPPARAAAPAGEAPWYADMEVHPVGTYAPAPVPAAGLRELLRAIDAFDEYEQAHPLSGGKAERWLQVSLARAALLDSDKPGLDEAWAEAEAALPEGGFFSLMRSIPGQYHAHWREPGADEYDGEYITGNRTERDGYGPTPAAALRALIASERER